MDWVFSALCQLSLFMVSRDCSLLWCVSFSLWWLLLLQYDKPKVPYFLLECPPGPALRTTDLETSLHLARVVGGLFLPYWKLCLSKSLQTLIFNKPTITSHEDVTCLPSEILYIFASLIFKKTLNLYEY